MGRRSQPRRAHPTPTVPVELDGETYRLRYSNRSLVLIEDETGWSPPELQQRLQAGSMKAVAALVWGGLLHSHPRLTLLDVADMIDADRVAEIGRAADKAMALGFGVGAESDEAEGEGDGGDDEPTEDDEGNG